MFERIRGGGEMEGREGRGKKKNVTMGYFSNRERGRDARIWKEREGGEILE